MPRTLRRLRSWRRWVKPALIAAGACFAAGVFLILITFAVVSRELPNPGKISERAVAQSTRIYDKTGKILLYEIHGDKKRTVVAFSDIPDYVKKATISAEDKDFYHHPGFDLRGILRAMFRDIIHLNLHGEGGSTITQQFVKNSILTPQKTFTRKLKELILSYQIEKKFTKDEILGLYLNEIPYGSNAYGIEAASQLYFGKPAKELTLAQSTVLAAMPQSPTYYSPYGNHLDALVGRQHYVLATMVKEGYITQDQATAAEQEKLTFSEKRESITAPHFIFYVKEILAEKYGESVVEQGGLKVTTTLDVKNQQAAEDAVAQFGQKNQDRYNASNAALVSLDTKTGQILAMVGSRDYFDVAHDGNVNVTLSPRQPGSSLKPLVYATAFEKGYTPDTMIYDLVTNFDTGSGTPYIPHNYDSQEHGPLSLRKALAGSLNVPAVKVLYLAGINNVLDVLDRFGYTTLKDRSRYGLSLVLGGGEVTLLEHTSAYATLAREGVRHPVSAILRVEDKNGKVLEQFSNHETKVMDAEVIRKLTSILTDNDARSYVFGVNSPLILPDRPVAAKTGTTNDYRDGWTMGYTPSIATGVWVGNNDNSALKKGSDGVIVAAPIWNAYMKKVLSGTNVETFKQPAPDKVDKTMLNGQIDALDPMPVDKITKKVIPVSCRDTYPKDYVITKDFKETHDILYWVNKDDPRGSIPTNPAQDPQFNAWEGPVRAWAAAHGYPDLSKLPQERCDLRQAGAGPSIAITNPLASATLTEIVNTFTVDAASTGTVSSVSYTIDGVTVGSSATAPFSLSYTDTQFSNGPHTLIATATDAAGATASATVTFTYALPESARTITILSPQANAVFQTADFPMTLQAQVFDPLGIASVQLFLRDTEIVSSPQTTSGAFTLTIPSLSPGSQTIILREKSNAGTITNVSLPLTIQ